MTESRFSYVSYIRATPEEAWDALVSAQAMKTYFFGLPFEAELKAGGAWRRFFPDGALMTEGEILEFDPPSRLVLSWLNQEPEKKAEGFSRCVLQLEAFGAGTKLTVVHTAAVAESKLIAAVTEAWPMVLSNLKSFLETGRTVLVPADLK